MLHQDETPAFMQLLDRAAKVPAELKKEEEAVYRRLHETGQLSREALDILMRTLNEPAQ